MTTAATATRRKTTNQKGLGWPHRHAVARLKRDHIPGTPCWWCAQPMYIEQGLEGDHSIPRSQLPGGLPDRLLHGPCNAQRGDGSRDHLRPALTGRPLNARESTADLGTLHMRWPWS